MSISEEITELTKKLVRFKTTADNPDEIERCMDFIEGYFSDSDLVVKRHYSNSKPSLIVSTSRTKKPELFLVAHIDVVPAPDALFRPKMKGKNLYGRGTYDTKSSVAIMMALIKYYSEQKHKPDMALILTSDEETSGKDGAKFLLEKYSCKFAIVLDGGKDYELITQEKGALHIKITATGKNAHGSTPWEGINAVDKLLNLYLKLRAQFPKITRRWTNTLSIGMIQGGRAVNQVPDYAEMGLDMRFISDTDKNRVLRQIRHTRGIDYEIMTDAKYLSTDRNNPYVRKLRQSSKKVLGSSLKIGREAGASDGRYFARKNIPTVLLWPIGKHAHSAQEYVDTKSLGKVYLILRNFIDENIRKTG